MEASEPTFDELPLPAKRRVDGVCTRFEQAWAESRPHIEDFLHQVPALERPVLLAELLFIEIESRQRKGETPTPADYLTRFADHASIVLSVFDQSNLPTRNSLPPTSTETRPSVPGYEVLDELGRGGMGVVYKARHLALNRLVALKFILAGKSTRLRSLERFRREAEAVARLRHPNIVQIYDIGETDGQCYLALEYAEAGSLRDHLANAPIAPQAAAILLEQVVRAVQHAHRQGVVHLDLKPANILLAPGGDSLVQGRLPLPDLPAPSRGGPPIVPLSACTPKLTDFGLALLIGHEDDQTQPGLAAGTPSYMAPEQASGNTQAVGPATDIWALGATLYECLTGHAPFRAATPVETLHLVLEADPVPPSQFQPSVPRDLETICLKCLQKEPSQRYAGARELAQDLQRFLNGEPIQARRAGAMQSAWKWTARRPLLTGALLVVLLLVLGTLVGLAVATGYALVAWDAATHQERAAQLAAEESERSARLATQARDAEQQARLAIQRQTTALLVDRAHKEGQTGAVDRALLTLAHALTLNPAGDESMERAIRVGFAGWSERGHPVQRLLDVPDVRFLVPCPDGSAVLVASRNKVIRIGLEGTGREEALHVFTGPVCCLALSPDGTRTLVGVATSNTPGQGPPAFVLSADKLEKIGAPLPHDAPVNAAVFLPENNGVLTGCDDGMVRFWDAQGRPARRTLSHTAPVKALALSPDGLHLAVGHSAPGMATLWHLKGKDLEKVPLKHTGGATATAFLPDGSAVLTAGTDGRVRTWGLPTGVLLGTPLTVPAPIAQLAVTPDGRCLMLACRDGKVRLLGRIGGELRGSLPLRGGVAALDTQGERLFLSGAEQIQVRTLARPLSPATPAESHRLEVPSVVPPTGFALSRAGRSLLVPEQVPARARGLVRPWNLPTARSAGLAWPHRLVKPYKTAWTPDGKVVATVSESASGQCAVELRVSATGGVLHRVLFPSPVEALAFHPSGRWLAVAQGSLHFLDTATGQPHAPPLPWVGRITALAWAPNGGPLVIGTTEENGATGTVALRSWPDREAVGKPLAHEGPVLDLLFADAGKRLIVAGPRLGQYDFATLKPTAPLVSEVTAYTLAERGRTLVIAQQNGTLLLLREDQQPQMWRTTHPALALALLPTGQLITGDARGQCQAWSLDVNPPVAMGPPLVAGASIRALIGEPDAFAVLGSDGRVHRWVLTDPVDGTAEDVARRAHFFTGQELTNGTLAEPVSALRWRELARTVGALPLPDRASWHRAEVDQALAEDDLSGADWHLRRLQTLRPHDENVARQVAYLRARQGHPDDVRTALDLLPAKQRPAAWEELLAALQIRDARAALWCAATIARERPSEARWPEEQAAAARVLGNVKAREAALEEAVRRGCDVSLLLQMANERAAQRRLPDAARLFALAHAQQPLAPRDAVHHALVRLAIGDQRTYALLCRNLLNTLASHLKDTPTTALLDAVWASCLAPEGLQAGGPARAVLEEAARRPDVPLPRLRLVQGALALRTNDPRQAIALLADEGGARGSTRLSFLALAHLEAGNPAGRDLLKNDVEVPPNVWERLAVQALRREATPREEFPKPPH